MVFMVILMMLKLVLKRCLMIGRIKAERAGYLFSANSLILEDWFSNCVLCIFLCILFKTIRLQRMKINIVVPTGNFGNILAAVMPNAWVFQLKPICASNETSTFRLLPQWTLDKIEFHLTESPSMDIPYRELRTTDLSWLITIQRLLLNE